MSNAPSSSKSNGSQVARWSFTWNGYTEDDIDRLRNLEKSDSVRYLIAGRERASTGQRHLQGYVEFTRSLRLTAAKKILGGNSIHLEASAAGWKENKEYCSKEGDVAVEFGSPGGTPGRRTDLESLVESIRSGRNLDNLCEEFPTLVLKYPRGVQVLLDSASKHRRDWATQLVWRYGKPGTSKSRASLKEMYNFYPDSWCPISISGGKFINGWVSGCKGAFLDDFEGDLPLAKLLRLFDFTPICVDVKGGFAKWNPRIVWITSQESPEFYYQGQVSWNALKRRMSEFGQVFHHQKVLSWETGLIEEVVTERNFDDWKDDYE